MTAKRKAENLVRQFQKIVSEPNAELLCAMVCVNEILKTLPNHKGSPETLYWREVRIELQLL